MTLSAARGEVVVDQLFCAIVCLLLACQTRPLDASQMNSDAIDVDVKETLDPKKVAAAKKVFRQVPMPSKDPGRHGVGYGNYSFSSGAIRTQAEFDYFLGQLESGKHTYSSPKLHAALKDLVLDFDKEALLLLRHWVGSGSTIVRFGTPSLSLSTTPEMGRSRKILTLRIDLPKSRELMGTADEAQYCFPVVVDTDQVDMVVLEVEGSIVFAVDFDGALPQFEERGP